MRLNKNDDAGWSFTDMMFVVLICILVSIPYLMLLINPKAIPDVNVKKEANYIITMTWPSSTDCDVDMWVKDPTERIVSFQKKSDGLMSIERDDLGTTSDQIWHEGKLIKSDENREIWTLRGKLDGNYVVNAHLYNCKSSNTYMGSGPGFPAHVEVEVQIIRVNPRYLTQLTRKITLDKVWQEKTVARFELRDGGLVLVDHGTDFVGLVNLPRGSTLR